MPFMESPLPTPSGGSITAQSFGFTSPDASSELVAASETSISTSNSSATAPLSTIFNSLSGTWTLHRRLTSQLPGYPCGKFTGTATFTSHPALAETGSSYLYHETGELQTDSGLVLRANQKYIYHHDTTNEKLAIWFVKPRDDEANRPGTDDDEADYLYMELEMGLDATLGGWTGRGDHLCEMDFYQGFFDWRVVRAGDEMRRFGIQYKVKGPQKDYLSETAYVKQ